MDVLPLMLPGVSGCGSAMGTPRLSLARAGGTSMGAPTTVQMEPWRHSIGPAILSYLLTRHASRGFASSHRTSSGSSACLILASSALPVTASYSRVRCSRMCWCQNRGTSAMSSARRASHIPSPVPSPIHTKSRICQLPQICQYSSAN